MRAGGQRHGAVGVEGDAGKLLRRRRGDFEEIADAETAQPAAPQTFPFAARKSFAIGKLERLLAQRGEIAAVVSHGGRRLARHLGRPDLIAPPQRHPIDAHLGRRRIDQPLHVVIAFGPAGAAIGRHVRRVGERTFGRHFDQRRAVHALHVLHGIDGARHRRHRRQERAHIGEIGQPQSQEMPVGIERQFGVDVVVAAMAVGHKAARPVFGPFDRPSERPRSVQHADIFGKHRGFHAERAADLAGEDAHVFRGHAHRFGDIGAHAEDALRADMQREAGAVMGAKRRARLHGVDDQPAVDQPQLGDMGRRRESGVHRRGVAVVIIERDIVRHIVIEHAARRLARLLRPTSPPAAFRYRG